MLPRCDHCNEPLTDTKHPARRFCGRVCFALHKRACGSARFWGKVGPPDDRGCRPWLGSKRRGYGQANFDMKRWFAHRLAWFLTHGTLDNELDVLHKCDNPPCCNVDHLFLGTHLDNMRDMYAKGRRRPLQGSTNHQAKLDDDRVREMRALKGVITAVEIARRFGVDPSCVRGVLRRATWKHVE